MEENGKDIYAQVTAKIVADLENGVRSWNQPWTNRGGGEVLIPIRHNGIAYRGVNVLLLWIEAMRKGFRFPEMDDLQPSSHSRRPGSQRRTRSMVVFTKPHRNDTNRTNSGEEIEKDDPSLRRYTVFNVEQIDGLPADCYPPPEPTRPIDERIDAADAFVTATGAVIQHGGNRAFYAPSRDIVQMPTFERFRIRSPTTQRTPRADPLDRS